MGRRHSGALPGIRLHKPTGHARVFINGKEHWLGRYGSLEAQLKYDELVATYIASGRKSVEAATRPPAPPPPAAAPSADLTVAELALRWLRHIMDTRGQSSSTYGAGLVAARALHDVQTLPAREFGPRRLLEVRARFASQPTVYRNKKGEITAERPRTRRYVNDTMARIVQMFSWAATMELVPGDKPAALREVDPLRPGELTGDLPPSAIPVFKLGIHPRIDQPCTVAGAEPKRPHRAAAPPGSDIGTLTKESNALDFQAHTFVSLWPEGRTREERIANPRRVLLKINKSRTAQLRDYDLLFDGRGQFYRWAAAEEYEEFGEFAPR